MKTDLQNLVSGTSQDRMARSSGNGEVRSGEPSSSVRTGPGAERVETPQEALDVGRAQELYNRAVNLERAPADPALRSPEEAASVVATLREQVQADADKAYKAQATGLPTYLSALLG